MESIDNKENEKQLQIIIRHKELVIEGAKTLSKRLMEQGETDLAIQLLKNSYDHDNSKFSGIEWVYLKRDEEFLKIAHIQHITTNPHHPEYYPGGIKDMPPARLAEFVCDIYARSSEFGTDLRNWLKETALKRYNFSAQGKTYKAIKKFVDLLLEDPF